MKESRKYKRKAFAKEVAFTIEGVEYRGTGRNLGAGGMLIAAEGAFSAGQKIRLTLDPSGTKSRSPLRARIIRITDDGIAVQFFR